MITQAQNLKTLIITSNLTNAEIIELGRTLNQKLSELSRQAADSFNVGDQVEFDSKSGRVVQGQIEKINNKTVLVGTLMGRYKVSASMLRSIRG